MMQVVVFAYPSSINGLGVFARNFIPKGTVVWKYDEKVDWRVPLELLGHMSRPQREFFDKYAYQPWKKDPISGAKQCLPYLEVCGDLAMFFNHGDNPSCAEDYANEQTVAARDIQPGEELTCDYRDIECRLIPFLETHNDLGVSPRHCLHVAGDLVQ